MKQNTNFSNLGSQNSDNDCPNIGGINQNFQLSQDINIQNNPQIISQNFQNKKYYPKPIGIYNFKSNKSDIISLEQRIDEVVSSFIDQNKENIIKYVANEVENKLNEKIQPLNKEINNIKNNFNSLYEEEFTNFKKLDILNDCHKNIMSINEKVKFMKENIDKYNDDIKGFNISDNKLQFLYKLNKDLLEFITEINNENHNENNIMDSDMNMDIDEGSNKIELEQKRHDNVSQELDNIFYETMSLLETIGKEENININNENKKFDTLNNLKNTINNFETKFNYEKPIMEDNNKNNNINNNNCYSNNSKKTNDSENYNFLDDIPNFFE